MEKYKIHSTLHYGKVYKNFMGLYIWLSLSILLLILAIVFWNYLQTYVLLIIGAGSTILSLILILVNSLIKKKIKKWMIDAVKLYASCSERTTGVVQHGLYNPGKAIKVSFVYNNRRIVKESGSKFYTGMSTTFNRYVGKTIDILYSPTYDEVMLLKD